MEMFVSTKKLFAYRCVKLKSIQGLAQCTKLRLSECSQLEELESMETLASLEWLWLNRCVKLINIWGVAQCKEVQKLIVNGCFELEEMPNIEKFI